MKDFVFRNCQRWSKLLLSSACLLMSAFQISAVALNSTDFPDANFRSALATTLGISEGANFDATTVQSLNLTGKGITNLTGIANFTNIEVLILDDNDLASLNLSSNAHLETLSLKNNTRLTGFGTNYNVRLATNSPLQKLDCEGCTSMGYFANIYATYNISSITWLSLKNSGLSGWTSVIQHQPNLKYLDLTGTQQVAKYNDNSTGLNAPGQISAVTKIETLILANNPKVNYVDVSKMKDLKILDLSGTDIYFSTLTTKMTPVNNPLLESFSAKGAGWVSPGTLNGFQFLRDVNVGGSTNKFTTLTITNCPLIENININDVAPFTTLVLTNNSFTSLPSISHNNCTNFTTLNLNGNQFTDVPTEGVPSTVKFMTLQQNNFATDYTLNGATHLTGLDLGKNSFTKLTVTNTDLNALSLDACASLATLEMHGNENIVRTAESNDITATTGEGVYIKGLSALKTLNIENSNFATLGQNNSTQGCSGIETLKAAHNKFTTFSNAYTSFSSGSRTAEAARPSLEHLTGLKYLDLSHNELQDSLHLFKNTELETLIVHNNRTITEYTDNTIIQKRFHTPGDVGEFNDTTGLRMLNLKFNKKLKYIDISKTAIQHFARDARFDNSKYQSDYYMANFYTRENESEKARVPHLIFLHHCHELEEYYSDYNGMKSLGFLANYKSEKFLKLKRISQIETRGQDEYIMQGSLNPNGSGGCPNLEYLDISNSDLDSIGVTNCKNLKYLNVSGNFTKNNKDYWVSKSKWNAQDGRGFVLNLTGCDNLVECRAENIPYTHTVLASNRPTLSSLKLSQDPTNTQLKNIFVDNTGLPAIGNQAYTPSTFPTRINSELELTEQTANLGLSGIGTCPNLQLIYCNDNNALKALDVTENASLKYLHAYNNAYGEDNSDASGLNLANNTNLVTAWVSNSGLQSLDATNHATLDTLKCYDNAHLQTLTVSGSASMRYLDLARCHVAALDLSSNTGLVHFDCSNDVKCTTEAGNWISDLDFTNATSLATVIANNNNLYSLKAPAATLTKIEFAHNHINGIDLSHATALTAANIADEDNGRVITSEASVLTKYNETGTTILSQDKIYYLQLVENAGDAKEGHNSFLEARESVDELKQTPRPSLANDGMTIAKVTSWASGFSGIVEGSRKAASASDLDSEKTYGKIVVLTPTAEDTEGAYGSVTYKYNNGISESEFYLDWSAAASLVTGVDDVNAEKTVDKVVYVNAMGQESAEPFSGVNIVVTHYTDGSTSSAKILK